MLGWFKKKFGKKNKDTAEEDVSEEKAIASSHPQEDASLVEAPVPADPQPEPVKEESPTVPESPITVTEEPPAIQEVDEQEPASAPVQIQREEAVPIAEELEPAPVADRDKPELLQTEEEHALQEGPSTEVTVKPVAEAIVVDEKPKVTIEPEPLHVDSVEIAPEDETREPTVTDTEEVAEPAIQHEVEESTATEEELTDEEHEAPTKPTERAKEKTKPSFFSRLSAQLTKSREAFTYQLDTLFLGKKTIDAELFDDLEEILITADLGYAITEEVLDHARRKVKRNELSDPAALKDVLKEKLVSYIEDAQEDAELVMPEKGPFIIMVIGVNGVGKTTTIGKVAHKFVQSGQSVMLVAADTFRAAAVSQLQIWGERNGVEVFSQKDGADPSSVAFDAIATAVKEDYDVVIIDTAGRLHTQANLMEELKKIKRVVAKKHEGAPHEVMLVIDATTGQNGISQAKLFNEAVGITGIALTKLDGTAKGGIVTNISKELQTPIRFIGVGEGIEDLRDFDHREFIDALFEKDK